MNVTTFDLQRLKTEIQESWDDEAHRFDFGKIKKKTKWYKRTVKPYLTASNTDTLYTQLCFLERKYQCSIVHYLIATISDISHDYYQNYFEPQFQIGAHLPFDTQLLKQHLQNEVTEWQYTGLILRSLASEATITSAIYTLPLRIQIHTDCRIILTTGPCNLTYFILPPKVSNLTIVATYNQPRYNDAFRFLEMAFSLAKFVVIHCMGADKLHLFKDMTLATVLTYPIRPQLRIVTEGVLPESPVWELEKAYRYAYEVFDVVAWAIALDDAGVDFLKYHGIHPQSTHIYANYV